MDIEKEKEPAAKRKPPKQAFKTVDLETAKLLSQLRDRANKKNFGRPVRESEILAVAVRLVSPEHLKELQENTVRDKDRIKMAHEEFQKKNGKCSMEKFLAKLLRGEVSLQLGL